MRSKMSPSRFAMQESFGFPGGITEMKELIKNSLFN